LYTARNSLQSLDATQTGSRHVRPRKPTVLIYGHYDVQPPDPLDAWRSPPFEPEIRGDNLYARGASDDKGQLFTHLKACESWFRSKGGLPVNVKCIFEGEEEVGSTHFRGVLERNRTELDADVAVISDTQIALEMIRSDHATITIS
jgi:acetylornithine deacetylase/succinyl-diaminopimelate desuccinylase-like protein